MGLFQNRPGDIFLPPPSPTKQPSFRYQKPIRIVRWGKEGDRGRMRANAQNIAFLAFHASIFHSSVPSPS